MVYICATYSTSSTSVICITFHGHVRYLLQLRLLLIRKPFLLNQCQPFTVFNVCTCLYIYPGYIQLKTAKQMCQCIEKCIIFHELFGTSTTCVVTQEDISAQSVPAVHSFQCLHLFVHLSRPHTAKNGEANVSVHRKIYCFSCIIRYVHDVRSDAGTHFQSRSVGH
jgi:hypothetical protein